MTAFQVQIAGQTVPLRFQTVSFAGIREIVEADVTAAINARAAKASNLSDLASASAARTNIGADLATNVNFTAAGTGAVAVAVQTLLRSLGASPVAFGATGDGVADDTAELQAVFNSGASLINFGSGYTFKITDTVTVPDNVSVDFGTSRILYAGTRDRAAFQFGSNNLVANAGRLWRARIDAQTVETTNDSFVGLKIYNAQRTKIDVDQITGFTHNIEFVSKGVGVTGVRLQARFLGTCKYALTTTCDGAAFNYINSNTFEIEEWTNQTTIAQDTHGWFARGIAGASTLELQNGNTIHFHGIQPGNSSGYVRNAAKLSDIAGYNQVRVDRYESGNGPIASISGPVGDGSVASPVVVANKFLIGLLTNGGGDITQSLSQTGSARGNVLEWLIPTSTQKSEARVDDLVKKIKAYNSANLSATGGVHLTTGTGEPALVVSTGGIESDRYAMRLTGTDRSIGFFIDIEGGETFMMWAKTLNSAKAFLGVSPYDSTGARLASGGVAPGTVYIVSDVGSTYNRWTTNMGGCYQTGSGVDTWIFTAHADVKRLRVFVQSGQVQSFGIVRLDQTDVPLVALSGLDESPDVHYVLGDPTGCGVGAYGRGDVALANNASGAGLDAYQFTLGGRYAPAWAITTAYALGQLRTNGGNIYEVTTAGTSAGAGGPTGTGTGIVDGTVVWRYVTTLAIATAV